MIHCCDAGNYVIEWKSNICVADGGWKYLDRIDDPNTRTTTIMRFLVICVLFCLFPFRPVDVTCLYVSYVTKIMKVQNILFVCVHAEYHQPSGSVSCAYLHLFLLDVLFLTSAVCTFSSWCCNNSSLLAATALNADVK